MLTAMGGSGGDEDLGRFGPVDLDVLQRGAPGPRRAVAVEEVEQDDVVHRDQHDLGGAPLPLQGELDDVALSQVLDAVRVHRCVISLWAQPGRFDLRRSCSPALGGGMESTGRSSMAVAATRLQYDTPRETVRAAGS